MPPRTPASTLWPVRRFPKDVIENNPQILQIAQIGNFQKKNLRESAQSADKKRDFR
jgi:hypothetical protein